MKAFHKSPELSVRWYYQKLTLRCMASMVEVTPLSELDTERPQLQESVVQSLIATKRG